MRHSGFTQMPDVVQILSESGTVAPSTNPLDPSVHQTGSVYYNPKGGYLEYLSKIVLKIVCYSLHGLPVSQNATLQVS